MSLKGDWSIAKVGIKIWSAYRFEFLIFLLSTPLSLVIYYYLWKSIYAYMGTDIIEGFTLSGMISYYVLTMIIGFFTWSEVDKWIETDLIYGHMIKGLLKPISFISWYLSFELGMNLINIATQMVPIFIIGFVFFDLQIVSAFNVITFLISLLFASLICFGLTYMLGLSAFWIKRITGLRRVRRVVFAFFSGSFLPLTLFPAWAQEISHYLPFEHMNFVPINIFLGTLTRPEIFKALAIQLTWVAAIFIIAHFIWKQAYKHITSVGL